MVPEYRLPIACACSSRCAYDASRGRDSGGFGIGLAIVKQVARWHGGTVEIGDSPLGGACVTTVR